MKEKIHGLWFEMIVTFWALSDFQIFRKHKKSLVMRIASLQECFAILGKIKKKKKEDGLRVNVRQGSGSIARKTIGSQPSLPTLGSVSCVTGWSSWIFKVGKTLYSVQK